MNTTINQEQRIARMEDTRLLVLSRAQGPYGIHTAYKHANQLMHEAMQAFSDSNIPAALDLLDREFTFNSNAFGADHAYTQSSLTALRAILSHTPHGKSATTAIPTVQPA